MKNLATLFMTTLVIGTAAAQASKYLTVDLALNTVKTVMENGKPVERLTPARSSLPGDLLSQVVTVKNIHTQDLKNVRVPVNVPANTVYVTAEPALDAVRAEYSIDGGKTFAPAPLKRKVTVTENGKTVTREVEVKASEYQAVRYTIPALNAGQTLKFGFRVKVK